MKVRVPADVDMADRIFAGLTARQLAILGGHALVLWALWSAVGTAVSPIAFGVVAAPVAALGLVWATAKPDGTTIERLAAAALRHFRAPRRLVPAPDGLPQTPAWAGSAPRLALFEFPVSGADVTNGHLDLGTSGAVAVCRASALNFALRSEEEQQALVEGFARLLNSLDAPVQFLVRSGRADVGALVDDVEERAAGLPHRALEAAALEHAAFLRSLAARRDVLLRQVLVCFREQSGGSPDEMAARLDHRVDEAATLLRGMGIRLDRLTADDAAALLALAADPENAFPCRGCAAGIVEGLS